MTRFCFAVLLVTGISSSLFSQHSVGMRVAREIDSMVQTMLQKWYPASIDTLHGGFLSTFTFDFKPTGNQDKMIVTQARHLWTNAKASERYSALAHYKTGAQHGFIFLRDVFWDKTYGGFYTLVDRSGKVKDSHQKTAYGNAFGIYALAAWYRASGDPAALQLAQEAFHWLEKHSHDPVHQGYFQHLQRDGTPVKRTAETPSRSDVGYKDQNSSIHLLEAFTELYAVWPDPLLKARLQEMLELIRDRIVTEKGYMVLFFQPDWTPVSFRDSSESVILGHRYLDHVSFGHDVETAYLLLEAAEALGMPEDPTTLAVAKRMVDHALDNGWDKKTGGFYDQGYYFKDKPGITLIRQSKNWWAQAEGLNTLQFMSVLFPDDPANYYSKFMQQWDYILTYLADPLHGDWYEEGLDHAPQRKTALKGHIWKAMYHQYRALTHTVDRLSTP